MALANDDDVIKTFPSNRADQPLRMAVRFHHDVSIRIFAGSGVGRCLGCCPGKDLDDAHAAATAWAGMLWRFRLFGLCGGGLDGVDREERHCEQLADTRDIVGACRAGQQAVVTDAVEALWQHMHQEAADELVGIERHQPASLPTFETVILPFEGDAPVIECDQGAVRDSDAMRYSARDSATLPRVPRMGICCRPPTHGYAAAPNRREGLRIGECGVLPEELQLSCTMSVTFCPPPLAKASASARSDNIVAVSCGH
jgi:hypothetical protein